MQKGRHRREITTTGVYIERNDRHCVIYRGTREGLIAAGLAKPGNFPEGNKRLSWHYPESGENWAMRRKNGDVYCFTKLKDGRGLVDAEVAAFKLAAAAEARRDASFQRFMERMRHGLERADSGIPLPAARSTQNPSFPDFSHGRQNDSRAAERRPAQAGNFERLAVTTLLVGITIYFWMRQA
jgi:hypothetical protein